MMNKGTTTEISPVQEGNLVGNTIRDFQKFDELVELFLYPIDSAPSVIGELCKKGKKVFYAFFDGVYYEAPTALQVAQKLATLAINK
jgi:hypothetical protein